MTTASGLEIGERGATLERWPRVTPDVELAMACRLARESVLRACHEAIFDLLSGLGGAESPAQVRVKLLASELIREGIYLSWPPFEPAWEAQHDCA
ncbi:MAG: hypothetical protein ABR978_07315 [Dehalococcoidia bacterium]